MTAAFHQRLKSVRCLSDVGCRWCSLRNTKWIDISNLTHTPSSTKCSFWDEPRFLFCCINLTASLTQPRLWPFPRTRACWWLTLLKGICCWCDFLPGIEIVGPKKTVEFRLLSIKNIMQIASWHVRSLFVLVCANSVTVCSSNICSKGFQWQYVHCNGMSLIPVVTRGKLNCKCGICMEHFHRVSLRFCISCLETILLFLVETFAVLSLSLISRPDELCA